MDGLGERLLLGIDLFEYSLVLSLDGSVLALSLGCEFQFCSPRYPCSPPDLHGLGIDRTSFFIFIFHDRLPTLLWGSGGVA